MTRCRPRAFWVCVVAWAAGGCASHQPPRGAPGANVSRPAPSADSLETAIAKIRRLQMAAKPSTDHAATIEAQPGDLRNALEAAVTGESPASLRRVAEAYYRAGVLDRAYSYYARALKIDRRDGAAYDGMARIWRDWRFPELAVGDAYRATYYAPHSASAYNTLGTVLHAIGNRAGARSAFERALALEPRAAYALNNLCYSSFVAGDATSAIAGCRRALDIDPGLVPAQNNLALAFAADGDLDASAAQFARSGDAAAREFNLGIVLASAGRHREAERSFQTAANMKPDWTLAAERARQSGRIADDEARRGFIEPASW